MADVRLTATNPEDSSVVPVACDASGRLLLEELPAIDTIDGDLTVTGKATFAGGKSIIGNDGSAQFAQGAVDIYADGRVEFTQDVTFGGLANFAGRVSAPEFTTSDGVDIYFGSNYQQGSIGDARGAGILRLTDIGSTQGEQIALRISQGGVQPDDCTIKLNYNGSATFGSTVKSSGWLESIRTNLSWYAFRAVHDLGNGSTREYARIGIDGSATFADGKAGFTAEGYLWCTTRRGDTVILDATSNGLASWAEYTPTTRIDDIRDRLDAIREEAADTQ